MHPPADKSLFAPHAKEALERSVHEAETYGHKRVDAEHVLCALTREPDSTDVDVLTSCDASYESIRERIDLFWRARPTIYSDVYRGIAIGRNEEDVDSV